MRFIQKAYLKKEIENEIKIFDFVQKVVKIWLLIKNYEKGHFIF